MNYWPAKYTLRIIVLPLLTACFFLAGCTAKGWYEGFQQDQRRVCDRYPQQHESQRCIEKTNGMTYDEYKNQRDELIKK
ncbi:MAG: hypothetical protein PHI31_11630 [Desulfuromonadaceae bacterium]|nr:hypothetical protein [Desulfuromonadaceae bacterium]